jgi:hypothetical protein
VGEVFQPASPIQRRDLFAGRLGQIVRVADAVSQVGLHVVIFGERGVGKTSLANILGDIELGRGIRTLRVGCDPADTFGSCWDKLAVRLPPVLATLEIGSDVAETARLFEDAFGPDDIVRAMIAVGKPFVCVFDEFDRMPDREARRFSDLIKALSDNAVPATIILVGVAETVADLVGEHASIGRALVQIEMQRMEDNELGQILTKARDQLGITFSPAAHHEIVALSQGLPHYTHLLGRESARSAIVARHLCVGARHVGEGIAAAIHDAQATIRDQNDRAVSSAQTDALYRQVLLSCALARKGPRNSFRAADVARSMTRLMQRDYQVPAIARHLTAFSIEEARGMILERRGGERNRTYRFSDPLMDSYVLMRGIAEQLVDSKFINETFGESPSEPEPPS